jgi:dUTP pyrophosphatase
MVVSTYTQIEWEAVDAISDTERGEGGFGHTGAK